jgi:hypothetical protein
MEAFGWILDKEINDMIQRVYVIDVLVVYIVKRSSYVKGELVRIATSKTFKNEVNNELYIEKKRDVN